MFQALFNGIFKIIMRLFNALLSPVVSAVVAVFPAVKYPFRYINRFLNRFINFVPFILELLHIPRSALVSLFDYFVVCSTIYYSVIAIRFALNIYNKLKT